jgi:hypothetical protein
MRIIFPDMIGGILRLESDSSRSHLIGRDLISKTNARRTANAAMDGVIHFVQFVYVSLHGF